MEWGNKQPESEKTSSTDSHLSGGASSESMTSAAVDEKGILEQRHEEQRRGFSLRLPRIKMAESKKRGKLSRIVRTYWYVALLVIGVVGALVGWQVYNNQINAKWSEATDYYGKADYTKAAKELEGLDQPKDEERLRVYAQTMLATRNLDKSLPAYGALYEQKKDPSVKLIIGNIYNEQKKYDEAAKTYRELILANGSYIQAYVNLSTLNKLQGKSQDAIAVAKQGVAANPNSAVLHELLISMLLENKDSDDYKKAVEALKKLNPQDPIFDAIKE